MKKYMPGFLNICYACDGSFYVYFKNEKDCLSFDFFIKNYPNKEAVLSKLCDLNPYYYAAFAQLVGRPETVKECKTPEWINIIKSKYLTLIFIFILFIIYNLKFKKTLLMNLAVFLSISYIQLMRSSASWIYILIAGIVIVAIISLLKKFKLHKIQKITFLIMFIVIFCFSYFEIVTFIHEIPLPTITITDFEAQGDMINVNFKMFNNKSYFYTLYNITSVFYLNEVRFYEYKSPAKPKLVIAPSLHYEDMSFPVPLNFKDIKFSNGTKLKIDFLINYSVYSHFDFFKISKTFILTD